MPTEPELRLVVAHLAVLRAELADAPDHERLLTEAEAHLREATARGLAEGLWIEAAQRAAIARFGRVQAVANAARGTLQEPVLHDARDGLPQLASTSLPGLLDWRCS
jgi:hypothetical protein